MTPRAASLALAGVTKLYGATRAVDDLTLSVPAGTMLGLLGPSGCGKTTVLRMTAGLVPVTSGRIAIDGDDVTELPPHRRDVGLVFQHYALFPHMTVAANIAFGLEMRGVAAADIRRRVDDALAMVRLPDLGGRTPQQLSGGQQQRVALARALVIRPRLLLLDEPLSNLDARLRDELRAEIREIQQRLAITTVFVTHDQSEALAMCDTVGVMAAGRLAQLGTPRQVYQEPASRAVAEFVGRVNVLRCEVTGPGRVRIGAREFAAVTPDGLAGAAVAVVRPHHIALDGPAAVGPQGANRVPGTIARTTFVGDLVLYDVDVEGARLKVEAPAGRAPGSLVVGDTVVCMWAAHDMRVVRD